MQHKLLDMALETGPYLLYRQRTIMAGKIRSIIEIIIQTILVAGVVYIIARAVL